MAIDFKEPNFRCKIAEIDEPEKFRPRLVYAESAEAAIKFLEDKGYIVDHDSVEPYDFSNEWLARAREEQGIANAALAENGKDYKWKHSLWKELKDHLQDLFSEKCAYCDSEFMHVSWGDVEHYRPKGKVTDVDGKEVDHPGYYWLAYEPTNYLPSCERCNRGNAKLNKFPINGKRAMHPKDPLDDEDPLLINPYEKSFREHVHYCTTDSKTPGVAMSLDSYGEMSVKAYRLNRNDLPKKRHKEQKNARRDYMQAMVTLVMERNKKPLKRVSRTLASGAREFADAAMDEVNAYMESIDQPKPFP